VKPIRRSDGVTQMPHIEVLSKQLIGKSISVALWDYVAPLTHPESQSQEAKCKHMKQKKWTREELRIRATQYLLDEGYAELYLEGGVPKVRLTRTIKEVHKALGRFKKRNGSK